MPAMPASLEALQNKTKMVNTKKIKHKDEIITFSESDYNRLLSLPVEERRAVVERGYDYVKNQKLQKRPFRISN